MGVVKVLRRTAGVQVAKRQLALSIMQKKKARGFLLELSLGGDYLRLPMSLTIGVEGLRALGGMGRGAETKKETQERIPESP